MHSQSYHYYYDCVIRIRLYTDIHSCNLPPYTRSNFICPTVELYIILCWCCHGIIKSTLLCQLSINNAPYANLQPVHFKKSAKLYYDFMIYTRNQRSRIFNHYLSMRTTVNQLTKRAKNFNRQLTSQKPNGQTLSSII